MEAVLLVLLLLHCVPSSCLGIPSAKDSVFCSKNSPAAEDMCKSALGLPFPDCNDQPNLVIPTWRTSEYFPLTQLTKPLDLQCYTNLKVITFESLQLPSTLFSSETSGKIKSLACRSCQFESTQLSFGAWEALESLVITGCGISDLTLSPSVKNLKYLTVDNNPGITLNIDASIPITALSVSNCSFTLNSLQRWPREVNLSHNNIAIDKLNVEVEIERLDLSNNQIEDVMFKYPEKLKYLNLSHNKLQKIPTNWHLFSSLTYLDISYNQYSGNLWDISDSTTLQVFKGNNNKFVSISNPDSISDPNVQLVCVDISNNFLEGDVSKYLALPTMRAFWASGNKLQSLSFDEVDVASDKLEILDLSNNLISGNFPTKPRPFKVLNLANNRFTGLIPIISNASVQENGILPEECRPQSRKTINLQNNQFNDRGVYEPVFEGFDISMSNNPWNCPASDWCENFSSPCEVCPLYVIHSLSINSSFDLAYISTTASQTSIVSVAEGKMSAEVRLNFSDISDHDLYFGLENSSHTEHFRVSWQNKMYSGIAVFSPSSQGYELGSSTCTFSGQLLNCQGIFDISFEFKSSSSTVNYFSSPCNPDTESFTRVRIFPITSRSQILFIGAKATSHIERTGDQSYAFFVPNEETFEIRNTIGWQVDTGTTVATSILSFPSLSRFQSSGIENEQIICSSTKCIWSDHNEMIQREEVIKRPACLESFTFKFYLSEQPTGFEWKIHSVALSPSAFLESSTHASGVNMIDSSHNSFWTILIPTMSVNSSANLTFLVCVQKTDSSTHFFRFDFLVVDGDYHLSNVVTDPYGVVEFKRSDRASLSFNGGMKLMGLFSGKQIAPCMTYRNAEPEN